MIDTMKSTILSLILAMAILLSLPQTSQAKKYEEERDYDARLDGYTEEVRLEPASTALTWILLIGVGVVCCAVLFKDARRTHLD